MTVVSGITLLLWSNSNKNCSWKVIVALRLSSRSSLFTPVLFRITTVSRVACHIVDFALEFKSRIALCAEMMMIGMLKLVMVMVTMKVMMMVVMMVVMKVTMMIVAVMIRARTFMHVRLFFFLFLHTSDFRKFHAQESLTLTSYLT